MGKEYTRDATEHGQIMIAEAIRGLSNGGGGESSITVDTEITENSTNPVTSAAIYEALQNTKGLGFKINVTQSEHQTITYDASIQDLYFYSSDGNSIDYNPPSNGSEFRLCVVVTLSIQADSGYNHGAWVVEGEVPIEHGDDAEYQDNYSAYVFLGDTLNVSATPATPV